MSDYFTYTNLTANTVARAADVNARFAGVSAGFDLLPPPQYISEDRLTYADDSGAANAYVSNPTIPITAYNAGLHLTVKALNANTGASTINVSSLGVKSIKRSDGSALEAGDIVAGQILDLNYDGTNFRLSMAFAEMSPAGVASKIAAAGNIVVNGSLTCTSLITNGQTLDGLTAFGVSLAEAANAAAGRSLFALGTMATETAANYALLAGPALTGVPTAPTAAPGTNTTQLATTAFVTAAISGGSAAPINSPTFTGDPKAPTPATADNDTSIATTAYVQANLANYALLASPTLTGTPAAPTAAPGTNTTQLATTAFVTAAVAAGVSVNNPSFTGNGSITGSFSVADDIYSAGWNSSTQVPTKNAVYDKMETKADLASPTFTGAPLTTTPSTADDSTKIASTAYVKANLTSYLTTASAASTYAPLASPALTGNPTAPTQAAGNSSTRLATTAFVDNLLTLSRRTGSSVTLAVGDRGGTVDVTGTVTVNNSVFSAGDIVHVYNNSASSISIAQGTITTMRLSGTATTGTRTLAGRGQATIYFNSATECIVSGDVT